jgi:hypothetical protein
MFTYYFLSSVFYSLKEREVKGLMPVKKKAAAKKTAKKKTAKKK